MFSEEAQFEQILDEAIELLRKGKTLEEIMVMFPSRAEELHGLLDVVDKTDEALGGSSAPALSRLLASLPREQSPVTTYFSNFFMHLKTHQKVFASAGVLVIGGLFLLVQMTSVPTRVVQFGTSLAISEDARGTGSLLSAPIKGDSLGLAQAHYTSGGLTAADEPSLVERTLYGIGHMLEGSPAMDTREYLQTNYFLTLQSRHVADVALYAKTIVRGHDGRIDRVSVSDERAVIGFVVPKDSFEQFKLELKTLISARFMVERVNENNMLPEKQQIDQNTIDNTNQLNNVQKEKDQIVAEHRATIASFTQQITVKNNLITNLWQRYNATTSVQERDVILADISRNESLRTQLQQRLANENRNYLNHSNSLDASINQKRSVLNNLDKSNQQLLGTVSTVQGTLVVEHLGLAEAFWLFTPYNWILVLGLVSALLYRHYYRKDDGVKM